MIDPKKIGNMDRRVTISSTDAASGVDSIDSFGAPEKTFADWFTCWASREEASGTANQETASANRVILPASYNYYMHYRTGVTEEMRLTDEGIVFNITSVVALERKLFMRLSVEKIIE